MPYPDNQQYSQQAYPSQQPAQQQPKESEYSIPKIAAAVIIVLAVIGSLVYFLWPSEGAAGRAFGAMDCGTDISCFIAKANTCEKAVLRRSTPEGTVNKFVSEGCTIIKSIEEFSSITPKETISLLEGKEMTCSYEKGRFSASMVEMLPKGIENCRGELKDVISGLSG